MDNRRVILLEKCKKTVDARFAITDNTGISIYSFHHSVVAQFIFCLQSGHVL